MVFASKKLQKKIEVIVNPYNDKESHNRKGIMLKGSWSEEVTDYVRENNVLAVYLNSAKGWDDDDLHFLSDLGGVEELNIITGAKVRNLKAIEKISSLEDLSLTCVSDETVDFLQLKNLKKCFITWWPGACSIFKCHQLIRLYLDEIKLKSYKKLGNLKLLRALTIGNSNIEYIEWLTCLSELRELELLNCRKLCDFSPISKCKTITWLAIEGNKCIKDIEFLSNLRQLEVLDLSDDGEIRNLSPLKNLVNLKAFSFAGTTNIIDGDLTVLENLPKLSMLMFKGRRHYTHTLVKQWSWKNFDKPDVLLKRKNE